MRVVGLLFLGCLMATAVAQQPKAGLTKPKKHITAKVVGYVTEAEAKVVFEKAEKMLRKLTKSTTLLKPIPLSGSSAVARSKVVMQLDRLYEMIRQKVRLTPRRVPINAGVLRMSGPAKDKLARLVKLGAIGNYGPLAAGPADKLTVKEFGDALGFFIARMAEMTHMPNPKWSPALMDGT
ncbi:MAG: hypothetical protein ACAH95_11640 [Fimbriimonas sp.]